MRVSSICGIAVRSDSWQERKVITDLLSRFQKRQSLYKELEQRAQCLKDGRAFSAAQSTSDDIEKDGHLMLWINVRSVVN